MVRGIGGRGAPAGRVRAWPAPATALVLLVAGLVALRLAAAATLGLAPDEMYYWVFSRNLDLSYYDHPPAVAYLIRLSTSVAGHSAFGVRWLTVLLSGLVSLAVYRLAVRLYRDRSVGVDAAALLQATLFVGFGSLFVTPDAPLLALWLLALLAAAELWRTGRGAWWLAIGAAVGLAFLAKYTALFLGFGLLLWILVTPAMRRWLLSPWTYLGGGVGLALTAPVLIWNAQHQWASFAKQFGRAVPRTFQPGFLPEFAAGQVLLLTPFVAVLAVWGTILAVRETARRGGPAPALLVATTLPLLAYFAYHALFARVEANWPGPLVLAAVVMAAAGLRRPPSLATSPAGRAFAFCARWAVPAGVALGLLLLAHAEFRLVRLRPDPVAQLAGWEDLVREAERQAHEHGAGTLAGVSYQVTSALRYFGRGDLPALQLTERIRYAMEPAPDVAAVRARPVLVLAEPRHACRALVGAERAFARVDLLGTLPRNWHGSRVETYVALLAREPRFAGLPDLTVARGDPSIDCTRLRELRR